eukprot:Gb_28161 [translate_table: standard]
MIFFGLNSSASESIHHSVAWSLSAAEAMDDLEAFRKLSRLLLLNYRQRAQDGAQGEIQAHVRQVNDKKEIHVLDRGDIEEEVGGVFIHGTIDGRTAGHGGGGGATAGKRSGGKGDKGVYHEGIEKRDTDTEVSRRLTDKSAYIKPSREKTKKGASSSPTEKVRRLQSDRVRTGPALSPEDSNRFDWRRPWWCRVRQCRKQTEGGGDKRRNPTLLTEQERGGGCQGATKLTEIAISWCRPQGLIVPSVPRGHRDAGHGCEDRGGVDCGSAGSIRTDSVANRDTKCQGTIECECLGEGSDEGYDPETEGAIPSPFVKQADLPQVEHPNLTEVQDNALGEEILAGYVEFERPKGENGTWFIYALDSVVHKSWGDQDSRCSPRVPTTDRGTQRPQTNRIGQPKSKITHLIFCTTSRVDMPGADYQLTKLLGLRAGVKRVMMYHQGCFVGGTVLRVAKDLAENNRGARVLVVCSEITAVTFRGPSETHLDSLVGQELFGDGAAAVIVGADPIAEVEKPSFQLLWTAQTILPDSDGAIEGHLREVGLTFHLLENVPGLISNNIEKSLVEAFHQHVLSEYGNMSSACVHFILDEMRKSSLQNGCSTTGEGLDWGVLFGFGPGLTVETVVLRSVPFNNK